MVMTCLLVEILGVDAGPEEPTVPEGDTTRSGFCRGPGELSGFAQVGAGGSRPLVQSIDSRLHRPCSRPTAKGPVTRTVTDHDLVLVVDFGAQYAQLIARRVREARVYSEIVPHTMPVAEMLARGPKAIILSGGPSSVYEPGAPQRRRRHLRRPACRCSACATASRRWRSASAARYAAPAARSTAAPPSRSPTPGTLLAGRARASTGSG